MLRTCYFLPLLILTLGCDGIKLRKEPVEISGKALHADGTPITNTQISFHPMEDAIPGGAKLSKQGEFTVKLTPGKYAVYFPASNNLTPEEQASYAKIPTAYQQANKDFTVDVKAGTPLEIRLK